MNISLHLTNRCNFSCKYCYVNKENPIDMSWDTAKKAIDMAVKMSSTKTGISFFGGEPLLRKDLIKEIVTYCEEIHQKTNIKFYYNMTSNGTLLDEDFLIYARQKRISIALSHDGIREAHDANRVTKNQKGSFDMVDEKCELLLKYNPYASVIMVLNPNTAEYVYKSVVHLFNKGFKYIIMSMNYGAAWDDKALKVLKNQYKKLSKLYYEKSMANEKFFLAPFDYKILSHVDNEKFKSSPCSLGKSHLTITADGSIYPCTQLINDENLLMGHVESGITRTAFYEDKEASKKPCLECAIKDRCNHTCSCINKQASGDIYKISPVLCAHEKMIIFITDALAAKLYKAKNKTFLNKHYNELYPFTSVIEDLLKKKEEKTQ